MIDPIFYPKIGLENSMTITGKQILGSFILSSTSMAIAGVLTEKLIHISPLTTTVFGGMVSVIASIIKIIIDFSLPDDKKRWISQIALLLSAYTIYPLMHVAGFAITTPQLFSLIGLSYLVSTIWSSYYYTYLKNNSS